MILARGGQFHAAAIAIRAAISKNVVFRALFLTGGSAALSAAADGMALKL